MSPRHHVAAVVALPGTVAGLGPALLAAGGGARFVWGLEGLAAALVALVGVALLAGGVALVTWTIRLFMHLGQGTLAP